MRFPDPRALGVWDDDGDGVAGALESPDEGEDVGGGCCGGGAVVVGYLGRLVSVVGLGWSFGEGLRGCAFCLGVPYISECEVRTGRR